MIKGDRIEYADDKGSVVKNCYIWAKDGDDILFTFGEHTKVTLDGYAIIPIEEFEKLEAIKSASEWLDKVTK